MPNKYLGRNFRRIESTYHLSFLLLIAFAHASAKGAPPETPIIENSLIFSLLATSNTILGQSVILKFEIGSDNP